MTNSGAIETRQARPSDLDQLCAVRNNKDLFAKYLDECDGDAAHFLVAVVDGQIVGFGLLYLAITKTGKKKSHLPKLSDLYISEAYRRKGVATALVRARETIALQAGHAELYVSIDPAESAGMIALAHKLGYVALQAQPYAVTAVYYDEAGQRYEKEYSRLDFMKTLR